MSSYPFCAYSLLSFHGMSSMPTLIFTLSSDPVFLIAPRIGLIEDSSEIGAAVIETGFTMSLRLLDDVFFDMNPILFVNTSSSSLLVYSSLRCPLTAIFQTFHLKFISHGIGLAISARVLILIFLLLVAMSNVIPSMQFSPLLSDLTIE